MTRFLIPLLALFSVVIGTPLKPTGSASGNQTSGNYTEVKNPNHWKNDTATAALAAAVDDKGFWYGNSTDSDALNATDLGMTVCEDNSNSTSNSTKHLSARGCGLSKPVIEEKHSYKCPERWWNVWKDGFRGPIPRGKSLFYANFGAQKEIEAFAKAKGKKVLRDMLKTSYIRFGDANCDRHHFWVKASEAMAKKSSGTVNVLLPRIDESRGPLYFPRKKAGPSRGQKTIWEEHEWPALKKNRQVGEIWRSWDQHPLDMAVLIWTGPGEH